MVEVLIQEFGKLPTIAHHDVLRMFDKVPCVKNSIDRRSSLVVV